MLLQGSIGVLYRFYTVSGFTASGPRFQNILGFWVFKVLVVIVIEGSKACRAWPPRRELRSAKVRSIRAAKEFYAGLCRAHSFLFF